jgi:hypothetical protein
VYPAVYGSRHEFLGDDRMRCPFEFFENPLQLLPHFLPTFIFGDCRVEAI